MSFLAKVGKKNVWLFKVPGGLLLFMKILLKTAKLFSKHFPPGLSCILYFSFHKGKDTSTIPQSRIHQGSCWSQPFIKGVVDARELLGFL